MNVKLFVQESLSLDDFSLSRFLLKAPSHMATCIHKIGPDVEFPNQPATNQRKCNAYAVTTEICF